MIPTPNKVLLYAMLLLASLSMGQKRSGGQSFKSMELKPAIGLGLGMFRYFGEVNNNDLQSGLVGQGGVNLGIARRLNKYYEVGLNFTSGKLTGNERSLSRNLNFQTDVFVFGAAFAYNFKHLLPNTKALEPVVSLGLEAFEFNSKGDLFDQYGNEYHYWSDGRIMNLAEGSPDAASATVVRRDFLYETDLRESNLDGLGKYSQFALGIPVSVGVNFRVTGRVNLRLGTTFHITTTDLIDNISSSGSGTRLGNRKKDHFLYNHFTLYYDFIQNPRGKEDIEFEFVDYYALEVDDEDGDGVVDILDQCPGTPAGVSVDTLGCPLDSDEDGVPDYADKQIYSPEDAYVDRDGVELSNSDFEQWYIEYMDSMEIPIVVLNRMVGSPVKPVDYAVRLGTFEGRIPDSLARAWVQLEGVYSTVQDGKTHVLVGDYGTRKNAEAAREYLKSLGAEDSEVVALFDKKIVPLDEYLRYRDDMERLEEMERLDKIEEREGQLVVHLGNTTKNATEFQKSEFYKDDQEIIKFEGKDESTDYVTGGYESMRDAKKALRKQKSNGYEDASLKMVKNGQLATPEGNWIQEEEEEEEEIIPEIATPEQIDPGLIGKFTVKVKEVKSDVDAELSNELLSIADLRSTTVHNPTLTTYSAGKFSSVEEAKKRMEQLEEQGFKNLSVTQFDGREFNEIPLEEMYTTAELLEVKKRRRANKSAPIITKGLIFRVQLGAYRNNVNTRIFRGEEVIALPSNEGITKYVTGVFDDYEGAYHHKQKMIDKRFNDAFIVALKDGKRIPVSRLITQEEYERINKGLPAKKEVEEEQEKTEGLDQIKQEPVQESPLEMIPGGTTRDDEDIHYRIQLGMYDGPVDMEPYMDLEGVFASNEGKYNKLFLGPFETKEAAQSVLQIVHERGHKEAFIVKYAGDFRLK